MRTVNITSLPVILFAHKFKAEEYHGSMNKHHNAKIEVAIVTEGELNVKYNGKWYSLKRGDVLCNLFDSPLEVHSSAPHSHHTVCFGVDFEPTDDKKNNATALSFVTRPPENSTTFLHLIDEIIKSHTTNSENHLKHAGLFLQLLGELDNASRQAENNCSPYEFHYVKRAKKYIYEHLSEQIQQKDIATHLGISPEYLCTVFKKVEGVSIIHFINEFKLMHIKSMMETMNISLNQAAAQYGFSDPNYVSKLYKKYYNEPITRSVKLSIESNRATIYEPPRE